VKVDFLIVGQGLAGSLLAWQLLERGSRVLVVDRDEENTCSKVAAGLVTPIFGSGFRVQPDLETVLPEALQFYWDREEQSGMRFFHHTRTARVFRDEAERDLWKKRCEESGDRLDPFHGPLRIDTDLVRAPFGGFEMTGGGWLDVPAFLEHTRQHLLERAPGYAIARFDSADLDARGTGVCWKNVKARAVVFCEGWRARHNRFFSALPMNPAKGEILELACDPLAEEERILHREGWILPLGNGNFRTGSTYDHEDETADPTGAARERLAARFAATVNAPFTITGQRAALRPTIRQSRVVMGRHPESPGVLLFNGLGSKGVLNGPHHAAALARHLLEDEPLDPRFDLRENFPQL